MLAIAALRFGMGDGVDHCLGDSDLYAHARKTRESGIACGGVSNSFIMPLFFDKLSNSLKGESVLYVKPQQMETMSELQSSQEPKSTLKPPGNSAFRHSIFALARWSDDREAVSIEFYDSKPDAEARDLIRETARNLVRNSGWLRDKWPKWARECWHPCPRQIGKTSGIHTILNAWSVMINLRVNEEPGYEIRSDFYAEALKVINLGLDGKLDSLTIRAYLQKFGYARPQKLATARKEESDAGDNSRALLVRRTTSMNRSILERAMREMQREEHSAEPLAGEQEETQPPVNDIFANRLSEIVKKTRLDGIESMTTIVDTFAMLDEVVHMAIASVWEGMRQAGLNFAFGDIFTFRGRRNPNMLIPDVEAVLGPAPLIMPLFFGREMPRDDVRGRTKNRTKNRQIVRFTEFGHHLFAIATQEGSNAKGVKVYIMDSSPGTRSQDEIKHVVGCLVKFTGWLGIDASGRPLSVEHTIRYWPMPTPVQEGPMSCGFYQILNAWAVMIGIPIHPGEQRRIDTTWDQFKRDGLGIINMALAGYMDSFTILAFMNRHGYSADEGTVNTAHIRDMNTVAMTADKAHRIVYRLRQQARADGPEGATSDSAQSMDEDEIDVSDYPYQDIEDLLATGSDVTVQSALRALKRCGGDLQLALGYHLFGP